MRSPGHNRENCDALSPSITYFTHHLLFAALLKVSGLKSLSGTGGRFVVLLRTENGHLTSGAFRQSFNPISATAAHRCIRSSLRVLTDGWLPESPDLATLHIVVLVGRFATHRRRRPSAPFPRGRTTIIPEPVFQQIYLWRPAASLRQQPEVSTHRDRSARPSYEESDCPRYYF